MFAPSLHIHLKRTSMCGINVVGGGGGGGGGGGILPLQKVCYAGDGIATLDMHVYGHAINKMI